MRSIFDIPPVWLAFCIILAWAQGRFLPLGLSLDRPIVQFLAGCLIGAGLLLIALAALAFWQARTTIIPHQMPSNLITSGIFSRTRNPIYLGDAMVLAGLILFWDAVLSLPLVPIFVWWIERHFIIPEENRLRRKFRADFARYCQKTRRWV